MLYTRNQSLNHSEIAEHLFCRVGVNLLFRIGANLLFRIGANLLFRIGANLFFRIGANLLLSGKGETLENELADSLLFPM